MELLTTTIGAFPKPAYLPKFDWFQQGANKDLIDPTEHYDNAITEMGADAEALFVKAAGDVIADQVAAGIDIPTDGEVRRENYIHYHCRHLEGVDFKHLTEKPIRGGTYTPRLPTITGPVRAKEPFLPHDWQAAQALTERPVKVTLPGPMTLGDTVADDHYGDPVTRGADIAVALNAEVRALADAGCRHIQIDEPVFARRAAEALDFGFSHIERCFEGIPEEVTRTVHMCCGYTDVLDNPDYDRAPKESYFQLAEAIEASCIDAVSFEDAHRHNDLSLLDPFKTTKVIFGVVAVIMSRVETIDEIRDRLAAALKHIDAERLIAAPDCGLGMLGRELAIAKLENLCRAAKSL